MVFYALLLTMGLQASAGVTESQPSAAGGADTPPTAEAAERDGSISIDGVLDEPAWQTAPAITRFVQRQPVEGARPEARTVVRVLYDADALYIAARMQEADPTRIGTQLVRRDEWGQYDYFEVSLNPSNDRRTGYQFRVSAAGVQRDVYLYDDVREDDAWNAVWESAVSVDSAGWSAELRIPLSQLRYDPADTPQSWGVNFTRRRIAANETTDFALESRLRHGKVSLFGRLDGLYLPQGSRRLEVRPFVLAASEFAPVDPGDPFFDGADITPRAGVDLRYGLGAAFSVDATIAPDFGQVEVDPAVINLTAFETFFPEKRPFFVENAQIFDFGLAGRTNRLFYSRRIGREPQGSAPDSADFDQIPHQSTILGAAKLTGRTSGGLSIGGLAAVTRQEMGHAYFSGSGQTSSFMAEPRTEYLVGAARQDFRQGASQVSAVGTVLRRELPSDGSLDVLTSAAYNGGLHFEHNWGGAHSRDWALWGFFAGSYIRGAPAALLRIQTASNHYFQRPDATRFAVDSARTSLAGREWRVQFERRSATHWTGSVWAGEVSPGFEINDIGFANSSERLDAGARVGYQEITPGRVFRGYRVNLSTFQNWRHQALDDIFSWSSWGHAHKRGSFSLNTDVDFLNYWRGSVDLEYSPQVLSDGATRGGPLMVDPASTQLHFQINTDRRNAVSFEPEVRYEDQSLAGYRWEGQLGMTIQPAPAVQVELQPGIQVARNAAQYVTQTEDVGYAPTYGARYLFGDLLRRDVSMEMRVGVAFSPTLTFQLFAQPLISSGDYRDYRQLARPESYDFITFDEGTAQDDGGTVSCVGGQSCRLGDTRYLDFNGDGTSDFSFDEEDFNVRSLRVNAVLRWEYRPGSTLFLVWQHSRRDRITNGRFDLGRDLDALWGLPAENRLILKINYWLGL